MTRGRRTSLAIFLVAMPIMMGEMVIGRRGRMSAPNTLRKLAAEAGASPLWQGLGWLGLTAVFLVFSFFSVVAGWSLAYVAKTAAGQFSGVSPEHIHFLDMPFYETGRVRKSDLGGDSFGSASGLNHSFERAFIEPACSLCQMIHFFFL